MKINRIPVAVFVFIMLFTDTVLAQADTGTANNYHNIFPKGNKAPTSNFTGNVWVYPLNADEPTFHTVMGSVTFDKGARSNWHSHPSGQILLILSGVCYSQERGKPIQVYRKGDVVKCAPGVEHWHGASPDSTMTHIAVNPNTEKGIVKWLQPVTDEVYYGK